MASRPDYFDRYPTIAFERDDRGILVMRFHSDGGTVRYSPQHHEDWIGAFHDVGTDPDNRVTIMTGTGDEFVGQMPLELWGGGGAPGAAGWERTRTGGQRLLYNLINMEMPVIAAINGPAHFHSEIPLLSDITIASTTTTFRDGPHFPMHVVPGDGVHVVWPELLGSTRGRYFLLTNQTLSAAEAKELGVVNEVVSLDQVLPRALELAGQIAQRPALVTRYTRAVITLRWKRLLAEGLGYGLALEGLATLEGAFQRATAD